MDNKKIFKINKAKLVVVLFLIFVLLSFVIVYTVRGINLGNLTVPAIIGILFTVIPLCSNFWESIEIDGSRIKYYSGLISKIIDKDKEGMPINEIVNVKFVNPKLSKLTRFYTTICVSTVNEEIHFSPDLFEVSTLKGLFEELKKINPNIVFDNYTSNIMANEKDNYR